jgi:hypothetical protein
MLLLSTIVLVHVRALSTLEEIGGVASVDQRVADVMDYALWAAEVMGWCPLICVRSTREEL